MTLEEVMDAIDREFPYRHGWRYESRRYPSGLFHARLYLVGSNMKKFEATSTIDRRWALFGVLYKAREKRPQALVL